MVVMEQNAMKIVSVIARVIFYEISSTNKIKLFQQLFPMLASQCLDIPEGKDISSLRHGLSDIRTFTHWTYSVEDTTFGTCTSMHDMQQTLPARTAVRK